MKKLFFPLFIVLLAFSSCKNDEPVNKGTVTLNPSSKTINVPESFSITPTVSADGEASTKTYKWKTSSDSIASIDKGTVQAKRIGDAIITYYSTDGVFNVTCNVTVAAKSTLLNGYYFKKGASESEISSNQLSGYSLTSSSNANFLEYSNSSPLATISKLIYELDASKTLKTLYVILNITNLTANKADAEQYIKERFLDTNTQFGGKIWIYLCTESRFKEFAIGTKLGVFEDLSINGTTYPLGIQIW